MLEKLNENPQNLPKALPKAKRGARRDSDLTCLNELRSRGELVLDGRKGTVVVRPSDFLPSDFLPDGILASATELAPYALQRAYFRACAGPSAELARLLRRRAELADRLSRLDHQIELLRRNGALT